MREDRFTNTPEDAATYEQRRAKSTDDRPILAEVQGDGVQWEPGDPCYLCGSTDTVEVWDGLVYLGAHCNGCGRDDYADD